MVNHQGQAESARKSLRLALKPETAVAGHVDGGWWPHSRDLTAELPALAEALAGQLGSLSRVSYALPAWETAPRTVQGDGYRVRLEGFRSQEINTVHVTGVGRRRLTLVVVPPETAEDPGATALVIASSRDNTFRPAQLLTASGVVTSLREPIVPAPRNAGGR